MLTPPLPQFAVAVLAALVAAASAITDPNMAPLIDEDLIQRVKDSGAEFVLPCDVCISCVWVC